MSIVRYFWSCPCKGTHTFGDTKFNLSRKKRSNVSVKSGNGSSLEIAVNTIKTAETLVPYSSDAVNLGVLIWDLIDDIPSAERHKLLDLLAESDIMRLWRLAGERNKASISSLAISKVPDYSIWEDMPKEGSRDLPRFRGRALLPMGLGSFEKELFSSFPKSKGTAEAQNCAPIYGHVLHSGYATMIKNVIYPGPLYFKAIVEPSLVPMLSDTCDMVFTYSLEETSMEDIGSVAAIHGWRAPKACNPPPFDSNYTDYIRVVGPGVFVGLGYGDNNKNNTLLSSLMPMPLFFAMVRME